MADTKISALTGATTPLAGTEVVPVVQGGETRKVSVADLTTGRAISATEVTLTTGNLIIGTSGKGIDFSITASTGTSELLADYEEGTWTPVASSTTGAITSYTVVDATYTKIGRQVTAVASVTITNAGTGAGTLVFAGLPFTNGSQNATGTGRENGVTGSQLQSRINSSDTSINIVNYANATCIATNAQVRVTIAYFV
jgi:hypothetical protein